MTTQWEYLAGLSCLALYVVFNRFTKTPDFIQGFILGIGLVCLILGMLPKNASGTLKTMFSKWIRVLLPD
ncbi:MAG: hypothetical protein LBP19_10655 [Treponema sp.]|nr:hypothetical protein [Treponema sp.]